MSIDRGVPKRHALGVDFGTSNTVAVARWPDGRARPILIDGSPLLPSAVYLEPDGQLVAGRDAVHSARLDPARFEPNPKRRVDDGLVLLGDAELPVVELIEAVLARVAEEWRRAAGPVPVDVTLTCPATWGATRRQLLADAATRAGLTGARLVAEPVAAATYFADVLGRDVPIGSVVVVHDFGAGTFDASVVARTGEGFEVLAVDGRDDIGGLDVDAAIVDHLRGDEPEWRRLTEPETVADRRCQRQLWDDVRVAKERLSRTQSADLVVPLLNQEIHLTRDELERLARPVLDQTVEVTRRLLRWADLPEGRLAGVFLVGGASRIPLVATLLHRELGEAPVVIEQPELVVAEGSILADAALLASGPAAPGPTAELRLSLAETIKTDLATINTKINPEGIRRPEESRATPAPPGGPSEPFPAAGLSRDAPPTDVDDADTVRTAPDGSTMPPAVDPWPNAAPERWTPDPEQTVISDPTPAFGTRPGSSGGPSPSGGGSASGGGAGSASGGGGSTSGGGGPASGGGAGSASGERASGGRRSGRRGSGGAAVDEQAGPPAARQVAATRPMSPVEPSSGRRDKRSSQPEQPRQAQPQPHRPRPQARQDQPRPARRPKRRGGFLRFVQVLISIIVLIAAPLAAMVVAYSVGTGDSLGESVTSIVDEIRKLIDSRIA